MKHRMTILCAAVSCLYGVFYTVLLATGTDLVSGFVTKGSVGLRYIFALVPLAFCVFTPMVLPVEGHFHLRDAVGAGAVFRILCGIAHLAAGIFLLRALLSPTRTLVAWCAPFLCLFGVWLVVSFGTFSHSLQVCGALCGCTAYVLASLSQFTAQPSSLSRVMPVATLFSAVGCMLFCCLWAESLFGAKDGTAPLRRTSRAGLICFFTATCVALPQCVILYVHGLNTFTQLLCGLAGGLLGIVGLATALDTEKTDAAGQTPTPSEFEPIDF